MKVGKALFAQIRAFVLWTSFGRIVQRYAGDAFGHFRGDLYAGCRVWNEGNVIADAVTQKQRGADQGEMQHGLASQPREGF